jgi:hypothetical protein
MFCANSQNHAPRGKAPFVPQTVMRRKTFRRNYFLEYFTDFPLARQPHFAQKLQRIAANPIGPVSQMARHALFGP